MTPGLVMWRDISLAYRRGGAWATPGFCLITFASFAFALGPQALAQFAPYILAVAVFFSCLLALPGLFERDYEDGTLEQYLLSSTPLEWLMLAKLAAFWVAAALPLLVLTPLMALMAGMGRIETLSLAYTLLLATPTLVAVGAFGAALTLGARKTGFTQALVVLPLYIPPLIFAAGVGQGALLILAAMSLGALPIACFLCAVLVRMVYD